MSNAKMTVEQMDALFLEAHTAGMEAGNSHTPRPMVVGQPTTPLSNDIDYSKGVDVVNEGVCGFAWINIRPGTSRFARHLKNTGKARKDSDGGVTVWVGQFNQSYERKRAYANAFSNVLYQKGIDAFAYDRLD